MSPHNQGSTVALAHFLDNFDSFSHLKLKLFLNHRIIFNLVPYLLHTGEREGNKSQRAQAGGSQC